jgi:N-acetylglucosaminyldiphosphoundecaprenol N-acetyl-beta-D-mannosaminyltransferase
VDRNNPNTNEAEGGMMNRYRRLAILGVPIDNVTMDEAVEKLDGLIQQRGFHQVATANLDFLIKAGKDNELMSILQSCSLVVADGMPLVWASRMMGEPMKERVTGIDLMPRLARLSAEKGYGIYLLGASEASSAGAAAWIEKNYPGARIAGRYSPPPSSLAAMNHEEILQRIEQAKPDILLVAFGNPKQEKWLSMHRDRLQVPVAIGVGASLDFLAGHVRRAPRWVQRIGSEWLYRFYKEPRRLGGRYLSNLAGALLLLPIQILAVLAQPRGTGQAYLSSFWHGDTLVVKPVGRFSGVMVHEFEEMARDASSGRYPLILDLSATDALGLEAMGSLIGVNSRLRSEGWEFLLTGVGGALRRVLAATLVDRNLRIVPDFLSSTPVLDAAQE